MNNGEISDGRKLVYYLGMVLIACGVLLWLLAFVGMLGGCGSQSGQRTTFPLPGGIMIQEFEHTRSRMAHNGYMALGGMLLIAVGGGMMFVGRSGLAGSGLVLSPKEARQDLKPWTKMAGGMVQDVLEETTLVRPGPSEEDFDTTLRKLHQLYKDGILSESEYQSQKQAVLKKMSS